jgi:hypothetical protein
MARIVDDYSDERIFFKKVCKRCQRLYVPTGKRSKICEKCKIKYPFFKNGEKKERENGKTGYQVLKEEGCTILN